MKSAEPIRIHLASRSIIIGAAVYYISLMIIVGLLFVYNVPLTISINSAVITIGLLLLMHFFSFLLLMQLLLIPVYIDYFEDKISIRMFIKTMHFNLNEYEIKKVTKEEIKKSIPVFGGKGLFAKSGLMWNKKYGWHKISCMELKHLVLLTNKEKRKKKYVISLPPYYQD